MASAATRTRARIENLKASLRTTKSLPFRAEDDTAVTDYVRARRMPILPARTEKVKMLIIQYFRESESSADTLPKGTPQTPAHLCMTAPRVKAIHVLGVPKDQNPGLFVPGFCRRRKG
jgi:hypothetical protein